LTESFGVRLREAMAVRGPLCVGIDPHPTLLARWGLPDDVGGLERFCDTVVAALTGLVPVAKPQSAFFERHGASGIAVLESTIRQLRDNGVLVVLDAKRGDIGSTVSGYADAYLNPSSSIYVDAITASPYPGVSELAPLVDLARLHGGGVFVLALTSNPGASLLQRARVADGRTVAQLVIDEIAQLNEGAEGVGSFGVVIGATVGRTGLDLSRLGGPILAPGLGAQGASPADLRTVFGAAPGLVLPSYSREVLAHGPSVTGLREAAARALAACREALTPPVR
jgi:orotidine-5'-phosphate decarboxylase